MIRSTELHTDASKIETRSLRCELIEKVTLTFPGAKKKSARAKVSGTSATPKKKKLRSVAEINKWLIANADKVDAHAKMSTRRLIGRDSV